MAKYFSNTKIMFWILMILAMSFWGASWINAKILGKYITSQELIFYRYFITTITLFPMLLFQRSSLKISKINIFLSLLASIFLSIYTILFFDGVRHGTAGLGGAFVTTLIPIITFIILVLFSNKQIFKKDILALFLGFIGIMTLLNIWSFNIDQIFNIANLYFVLAALVWALLTITNSKAKKINHLVFSFYIYLFSSVIGFFITPFESNNIFSFDYIFWINIFIISVLSTTFATSIYFVATTKLGANEASSFVFLVPFNAIFLSYIFLDEPIYFTTILGTILTIIAVIILNKRN